MSYQLRQYQQEAIDALYRYFSEKNGNPIIIMPTGTGKSLVIAEFVRNAIEQYPHVRVLMLTHSKELIQQNLEKLLAIWPDAPVGVYSAGLNKRDTETPILFAGIQSVFRRAAEIAPRDLIIIDENHLVPADADAMYQRLVADLKRYRAYMAVIGLTATPWRIYPGTQEQTSGYDCLTRNGIFTDIAYDLTSQLPQLIMDGYLSMLWARRTENQVDLSQVRISKGEFVEADLEAVLADESVMSRILDETERSADGRRSWLVFCAGVKHAQITTDLLNARGIQAVCVVGDTLSAKRSLAIEQFKTEEIQALVSVNVMSTGFDAPNTDLICMVRPTLSPVWHCQAIGRGSRPTPAKLTIDPDTGRARGCLILDFAGNLARHGPIDAIRLKRPRKRTEEDQEATGPAAKECPECQALCAPRSTTCPACGFEFPHEEQKLAEKLDTKPADGPVIAALEPPKKERFDVSFIGYHRHQKPDKPASLRVEYYLGPIRVAQEWICFEHSGYAREKAIRWWMRRSQGMPPRTVAEALERVDELKEPSAVIITIPKGSHYSEVCGYEFTNRTEANLVEAAGE